MKSTFYITAAIPYVNAKPHLGHVLEWFQADTIARYQRLLGKDVAFTCGADENSLKNVQAAEKAGQPIQSWLDEYASIFKSYFEKLSISLTHFGRGSDQLGHWTGVQALWNRCEAAGDIYQKSYDGLYCVGCEAFYTEDELTDGLCPEHLKPPEKVTETNYFFKLSKYQDEIVKLISSDALAIKDERYKNEMLGFISQGLEDFSVSRTAERSRGIGVPVPNDPSQVMYVWFDALAIYLTAIGWGTDNELFEKYWPADVHLIGKGITRFHAVYWIGMLLSAGLELPKAICVHGYLTLEGQKMSKSLGNVIDPEELINEFALEPVRYYLLRAVPTHGDGDYNRQRFHDVYTAELANGLGNLCSRVAKLAEKNDIDGQKFSGDFNTAFNTAMTAYDLDLALAWIVQQISQTDAWLAETKPWSLPQEQQVALVTIALTRVVDIVGHLQPFLPTTSQQLLEHFGQAKVKALKPLFPRLPTN
ncbi:methionine--tRNA ligase [Candidatus Woesebacteria bacterium]|nr:methionine--tRNA ligase [Candidatus Woesebacteria bacterium]